jgi:tetratricopeptide (TPR) repeat protein
MATYTFREIQAMLGISRSAINTLMAAGFVSPSRGKRQEYRFTFQDLVMLRTAHSLRAAHIPPRKILRSLRRLRETLPAELPLSGLRITTAGGEIAVREGDTQWQVDSGQLLLDFEVTPAEGHLRVLSKPVEPAPEPPEEWFERGIELEESDRQAAEAAYRQALALAPAYVDACLNLGCLLADTGRHQEAIALYRDKIECNPDEPLLHFNLAVALEDSGQHELALAAYRDCVRLAPDFSDAHYNAALLCEALGRTSEAIRYFSAVRRLENK